MDKTLENIPRQNRKVFIVLLFIVIGVVLAVHWPSFSTKALAFDDDQYLINNELVQTPTFGSAARFLAEIARPSTVTGYYQPLSMISLMLDTALGGSVDDLMPYHRTSLTLHLANTILVAIIVYMLFGYTFIAASAGLLFGMHPMVVDTIVWVGERKTVLATFFVLCSIVSYIHYAQKSDFKFLILSVFTCVLALLSKPTSTSLPILLLLLDYWPLDRLTKRGFTEKIPFFLIGGFSAIITIISQRNTSLFLAPTEYNIAGIFLKICYNIMFYIQKIVWPVNLTAHYPTPYPIVISNPIFLVSVIAAFLLIVILLFSLRFTRSAMMGFLFFFIAIMPTMGIIGFSNVIVSNKFAYLPVLGLIIPASLLAKKVVSHLPNSILLRSGLVAAVICIAFCQARAAQNYYAKWQTTEKLWIYMAGLDSNDINLQLTTGSILARKGRYKDAMEIYRHTMKLDPERLDTLNNVAWLLATSSDPRFRDGDKAVRLAESICSSSGYKNAQALDTLAAAYAEAGRFEDAVSTVEKALSCIPEASDERLKNQIGERLELYKSRRPYRIVPVAGALY